MEAEHTDSAEADAFPYDMHTFRELATSIRQQIHQMNERISKLEHEREATTQTTQSPPCLPDSNGFWRDKNGDIWAYDGNPDHQPIFLFDNDLQEVCDNQPKDPFTWEIIKLYAPFTKISNPFPEGDHHAD